MEEKSIPERVLEEFIESFEGNKVFSGDDFKKLQKIRQKESQVTKKEKAGKYWLRSEGLGKSFICA